MRRFVAEGVGWKVDQPSNADSNDCFSPSGRTEALSSGEPSLAAANASTPCGSTFLVAVATKSSEEEHRQLHHFVWLRTATQRILRWTTSVAPLLGAQRVWYIHPARGGARGGQRAARREVLEQPSWVAGASASRVLR